MKKIKINAFYRMLLVFSLVALVAKIAGAISWQEVPLWIMVLVFFSAGVSHFTPLRHDFVKMIPPFFPAKARMPLVHVTGVIEIVGAIFLAIPQYRLLTSILLVLFLLAVFPANLYAAQKNIPFRGSQALSAPTRGTVQVLFIIALLIGGGVL
jgi:uncharacterized membrane protein